MRTLVESFERAEGFLGALCVSCVCGCVVTLATIIPFEDRVLQWNALVHVGLIFGLLGLLYGRLLVRAWGTAIRGELPFGPLAAGRGRRWPVLLRGLPAAWWLGHFLFGAGGLAIFAQMPAGRPEAEQVLAAVMMLGFTAASNLFLVLAAASLTEREEVIDRVWRRRIVLDVLAVAAVLLDAKLWG